MYDHILYVANAQSKISTNIMPTHVKMSMEHDKKGLFHNYHKDIALKLSYLYYLIILIERSAIIPSTQHYKKLNNHQYFKYAAEYFLSKKIL